MIHKNILILISTQVNTGKIYLKVTSNVSVCADKGLSWFFPGVWQHGDLGGLGVSLPLAVSHLKPVILYCRQKEGNYGN